MNALFWIFLAGSAAVAFPLVFHLIRRTPRGRQQFSSLMFLRPSPPRLTRRSRLDNLLLLLLRALAILLLALAFTRPFWRAAADIAMFDAPARRVAILVDTSASMRRGDLWSQAVAQVSEVLDGLEPDDAVALYSFDDRVTPQVAFDQERELESEQLRDMVRTRIKDLAPGWAHTDLGGALTTVADALDVANDVEHSGDSLQIVVVSDMQKGAQLAALQAFEWPPTVLVTVKQVELADPSNARVTLLAGVDEESDYDEAGGEERERGEPAENVARVRVTNSPDSNVEQFRVWWSRGEGDDSEDGAVAFYVPPGQSRVLRMPREGENLSADRLILRGDEAVFDNEYYVAPRRQQVLRLACIGADEAHDAEGLRFYLEKALETTPDRDVVFAWHRPGEAFSILEGDQPDLVVVTDAVSAEQRKALRRYTTEGGTLLAALRTRQTAESLGDLIGDVQQVDGGDATEEEAQGRPAEERRPNLAGDYAMLAEIDFSHPLFAPFAGARYNDFTKIHFWKHRRVSLGDDDDTTVVARFDDDSPAVWERVGERGRVIVLASGWHPSDSQLALSTKFVPLLDTILQQCGAGGLETSQGVVNQPLPLPESSAPGSRVVLRPDGGETKVASSATVFSEADMPGVYTLRADGVEQPFAVNLEAGESVTEPLAVEALEQLGVTVGLQPSQSQEEERLRQLRDTELENRQKIWKWLIVAALGVLGLETCLAGWRARPSTQASGEAE